MSDQVTASSPSDGALSSTEFGVGMPRVQSTQEGDTTGLMTGPEVEWLLKSLGIHVRQPMLSLSLVSPALILDMFTRIFALELEDFRPNVTKADQVHNMAVLLDALQQKAKINNVNFIDPLRIVERDEFHLHSLLSVFVAVHDIQLEAGGAASLSSASSLVGRDEAIYRYIDGFVANLTSGTTHTPREESSHARPSQPHQAESATGPTDISNAAMRQGAPDVGRRMQQAMSAAATPTTAPPAPKRAPSQRGYCGVLGFNAERAIRVTLKNRERDARIQALRSQRFADAVRDFAVSCHKSDSSYMEAMRRKELNDNLHRERLDAAELRKLASDFDATDREYFINHLQSLASARRGSVELSAPRRAASSARRLAADRHVDNLKSHLTIANAMSSWRRQNKLAAEVLPPR